MTDADGPGRPVVRIAGVDKTFTRGDHVVTKALEAIDLDVGRGEFVSLIGPSGCGKSTLLRIVGDLISPSSGTVTSTARPPSRPAATATTGWSSRRPSCSTGGRSRTTSSCRSRSSARTRATRTARAREMLELVELGDFLKHHPTSCRAGCSSASRSPARSRSSRRSC